MVQRALKEETMEGKPKGGGLKRFVHELRVDAHAIWLAVRDTRTPVMLRIFGALVAAYALSPIDLIPDFVPVLGLLENVPYRSTCVTTRAGDMLVAFSDGIVETTNRRNEYFGEERLIGIVQRHRDRTAQAICDEVLAAVRAFAGRQPVADDQTLLVVKL